MQQSQGQFGYGNQLVLKDGSQVIGCASSWTDTLPDEYHAATLQSLVDFFGTETTLTILQKSAVLAQIVSPPKMDELGIGHFAVSPAFRRLGVGKLLLSYYAEKAVTLKKSSLVLDVEANNAIAIQFYQSFGFEIVAENTLPAHTLPVTLKPHLHLRLLV